MNTVIYARYSAGPRQTDQSIEGQLRVCTDFCKQRGLTVIDTYCDRHISGRTDERPEFQRLITDAKRKKFEAVVVYKTDRFARNKYDSAVYKRELKRNGIQIFYAAEAIPDGPEGIILESLMEGLAEYYSAELAQKIKRGMHESALKCQSTGSGRPLGYRVDEQKHFQIDPESAQTVQTIFEQYIKGESNAAICELLNSRGLRTAQGKPFNKNSINRIIKNRKYIGEYRYHDIVVEGGMPAIISKDTFNLAQAEMERRRTRKAPKSPKAEYLLAGRLFCGHCKGPMQGVSGTGKSGNKWYYYYCGNTRGKNKTCDKKQVSRDRLERAVVDFTVRYILQEEVLEELARKVHAAQERQNDTASEIAFYEKKLADNKKSIANVLRAIESGAATQTLPARLQELENEQAVILGEISFLKGKRLAFTEDQILFALMKHLEPYPGESEQDYRRRIISDFVSEVYLYDDRLLIYFNISSEDGKLKSADLSNIEGGEFDEGLTSSMIYKKRKPPCSTAWRLFLFVLQKNTGRTRIRRLCRFCIIRSQICYRIRKRLAGAMVRQRHSARCGMAQIHDHQDLFVFGQAQLFCQLLRIKKVDPAAVHACIGSGQDHVGGHDGGILHTGVPPAAGVGEHIGTVKRHHQTGGCIVAAGRCLVDLCKPLCRLDHIDLLFLKILGSRRHTACLQDLGQLCGVHRLACIKIFAGIPVPDYFCKFHARVLSCLFGFMRSL